ncbi:hypothetical protein BU25DRAFT_113751 [Macroventuria anomochaeta]|uniref:Uncharacterized protein n=1 Tax=Macroventuria anomochaeta TaxID=301207 RepID=A0ACB6RUP6_9PLEO|nr:uncharacterized protein BU25DRAFT_113751 [Macroventuria anomochaeta]KAF2625468.1 hypothetical protein BU25DRAFT_113751 [Macroventuria anomochaeta]
MSIKRTPNAHSGATQCLQLGISLVLWSPWAFHMRMDQPLKLRNLTKLATSTSPTTSPPQETRSRTPLQHSAPISNDIRKSLKLSSATHRPIWAEHSTVENLHTTPSTFSRRSAAQWLPPAPPRTPSCAQLPTLNLPAVTSVTFLTSFSTASSSGSCWRTASYPPWLLSLWPHLSSRKRLVTMVAQISSLPVV